MKENLKMISEMVKVILDSAIQMFDDFPFDLHINKGSFSLTMVTDMKGISKMERFMAKVLKRLKMHGFKCFLFVLCS